MFVPQLLFVKFIDINWFNFIVLLVLFYFLYFILKEMKYTRLIKKTVQQHYSLFQFTNENKDAPSKERLIRAVSHEIMKTHKRMNAKKVERRTKLEINLMLLPMGLNILALAYKLMRMFILLFIVFLIYVIISMTYESIEEHDIKFTSFEEIKNKVSTVTFKETSYTQIPEDSDVDIQEDSSEKITTTTNSNDEYVKKVTTLLAQAQKYIEQENYDRAEEILYSLRIDIRLGDYPKLLSQFFDIEHQYNQLSSYSDIPWAPGIQAEFEAEVLSRGYIEPGDELVYKLESGSRYSLYRVVNGEEIYIVVVDVKTGWFHG